MSVPVVQRGLDMVHGEVPGTSYNVVYNNCEHFASWCRNGMALSRQVSQRERGERKRGERERGEREREERGERESHGGHSEVARVTNLNCKVLVLIVVK